ncbi:MAG: H-NS family nucleoid-associated regulatory protein [Lautropia sp.]
MTKLTDLIAQKAALEKKIQEVRQAEHADAVKSVRALIEQFGLTRDDIFDADTAPGRRRKGGPRGKAPALYRDPATGKTWSGRGREPLWLAGKKRDDFRIASN